MKIARTVPPPSRARLKFRASAQSAQKGGLSLSARPDTPDFAPSMAATARVLQARRLTKNGNKCKHWRHLLLLID